MTTFRGSCHCGAITFECDGELTRVEICNCSICSKMGYVHWYVPPEHFRLLSSKESITTYRFGTRTALNHFCCRCGISPFRRARSDPDKYDINVRCLEGVDIASLEVSEYDGVNWEASYRATRGG